MAKQTTNKERLLNAGLILLSKKTTDKISMDDVASEAGVTKPMVYYYFGNKVGFYKHLVQHIEDSLQEMIADCIQPDSSFREVLTAIIKGRVEQVIKRPELSNAIRIMAVSKTIGGAESRSKIVSMFNKLIPFFEISIKSGEIREDADLRLIMAMTNSLLDGALRIHGKELFESADSSDFAEKIVRLVFDGIGTGKRL